MKDTNGGWNIFYVLGTIILGVSIIGIINEHTEKRLEEISVTENKDAKSPEVIIPECIPNNIGSAKIIKLEGVVCLIFNHGTGVELSCNWELYNIHNKG